MTRTGLLLAFLVSIAVGCGAQARQPTTPRPPPPGGKCADVCRLSEAICRSKEDICRLAAELPGDDWARGRCDAARSSCADAERRCTACGPGES